MKLSQISGPHLFRSYVPAEGTLDADDTWSVFVAPFNCTVTAAKYVPNAAITANSGDYFTLDLKKGSTVVATRSWAATDSVANVGEAMTLSATVANRNLTAGDVVNIVRTHTGSTGLDNPDGVIILTVKIR